jgi:hypothetical protein
MSAGEAIIRFIVGGLFVSAFAVLADILKPKSFAGLFGAAPSIALATLVLTIGNQGPSYAALEARSMIGGALGFCIYAYLVAKLMAPATHSTKIVTAASLVVWFVIVLGFGIVIK